MYGLTDALLQQLREVAEGFHVSKLVLFGSRARGTHGVHSDVDLAVYGLQERDVLPMQNALEELPTLLKFDLVPIRQDTDAALIADIKRDGVILMERRITKLDQFKLTIKRTEEAVAEYQENPSAVVRDGAIQRFEFTTELAWKSCREKLLDEGYVGIDSPKATMRQALQAGYIQDEQGWLNLLQARNLTSHMYSEEQAQAIYNDIEAVYLPLMRALQQALEA